MAIFDDDQRRDRPQPPSALRVATGRADGFVAPPGNTQEYGFVVASCPRHRRARHKRRRIYVPVYLGRFPIEYSGDQFLGVVFRQLVSLFHSVSG